MDFMKHFRIKRNIYSLIYTYVIRSAYLFLIFATKLPLLAPHLSINSNILVHFHFYDFQLAHSNSIF